MGRKRGPKPEIWSALQVAGYIAAKDIGYFHDERADAFFTSLTDEERAAVRRYFSSWLYYDPPEVWPADDETSQGMERHWPALFEKLIKGRIVAKNSALQRWEEFPWWTVNRLSAWDVYESVDDIPDERPYAARGRALFDQLYPAALSQTQERATAENTSSPLSGLDLSELETLRAYAAAACSDSAGSAGSAAGSAIPQRPTLPSWPQVAKKLLEAELLPKACTTPEKVTIPSWRRILWEIESLATGPIMSPSDVSKIPRLMAALQVTRTPEGGYYPAAVRAATPPWRGRPTDNLRYNKKPLSKREAEWAAQYILQHQPDKFEELMRLCLDVAGVNETIRLYKVEAPRSSQVSRGARPAKSPEEIEKAKNNGITTIQKSRCVDYGKITQKLDADAGLKKLSEIMIGRITLEMHDFRTGNAWRAYRDPVLHFALRTVESFWTGRLATGKNEAETMARVRERFAHIENWDRKTGGKVGTPTKRLRRLYNLKFE